MRCSGAGVRVQGSGVWDRSLAVISDQSRELFRSKGSALCFVEG
jgi:hypothetical protein